MPSSPYISPEAVLAQEIAQVRSQESPLTDFSEGSIARTILEACGIAISGQSQVAAQLQLGSYLTTAEGEDLNALGEGNWFVPRLPAVAATGKITIVRETTTEAASILAGWSPLTVPPSVPGEEGVAVLTTEDANFAEGQSEATVTAQAVLGGTQGNLGLGTYLLPLSPIVGVNSQTGYKVSTAFTGGVNEETDNAYRVRIPLVVQGRQGKGRKVAYEANVLSIPGVESVGILMAGTVNSAGHEVAKGKIEVVVLGASNLLSQVKAAVEAAAVLDQEPTVSMASELSSPQGVREVELEAALVVQPGSLTETFKAEAAKVAQEVINKVGLGGTAHMSAVVEALVGLGNVVSITLPLTKFCLASGSGATDLAFNPDQAPHLSEAHTKLSFSEL